MKTKILPKGIFALYQKYLQAGLLSMKSSFTNVLEDYFFFFYEGKYLQLTIKHIQTYKYVILNL